MGSVVLLDTNALSEPLKKRPHEGFMARLKEAEPEGLQACSVSVFELRHGCLRHTNAAALWKRIHQALGGVRIVPFGIEEAVRAGEIHADLLQKGQPISVEDLMIGATAIVAGCAVVTRNVRHFSRIPGLEVKDWWT